MSNSQPDFYTRRRFLRSTVLGGALSWTVPFFLERTFSSLNASAADAATQIVTGKDSRILVVLQLAGGNDGLNTVIPFTDDAYRNARPNLGIPTSSILNLNDDLGLHPSLSGMQKLFHEGDLGIIQGVGYPNPNRSHFRSTEIWATASDANRNESDGWLGRYFDSHCDGSDPAPAISLTHEMPQSFASKLPRVISFADPRTFRADSSEELSAMDVEESTMTGGSIGDLTGAVPVQDSGTAEEFLRRTSLDAQVSSSAIQDVIKKGRSSGDYPGSRLGRGLQTISQLIAGGMTTRVYYLSHGGFDTHASQSGSHARLLQELDEAVTAFVDDLKVQGNYERVSLMTFSEFGRRVSENASGGTDHGAAAPLFMIGGGVQGGLHGAHPSLTDLHNGDVIHHTDFRSVYATVLENWLKVDSRPILRNPFKVLDFLKV